MAEERISEPEERATEVPRNKKNRLRKIEGNLRDLREQYSDVQNTYNRNSKGKGERKKE